MQLDLRVGRATAQAGDAAVLASRRNACPWREVRISGKRPARSGRERGADPRLVEFGERRVAVVEHLLRIELDPPRGRREAFGHAVTAFGILPVARDDRRADAARPGAERLEA